MRSKKYLAVGLAAAIPATLAMTDSASADDVLHDTLWMTDNGTYDWSTVSSIGMGPGEQMQDENVADDFTVPIGPAYNIMSVTADFRAPSAWGGEGVLVEFFSDIGDKPSYTPIAVVFLTAGSGLSVSPFSDHIGGQGTRFTMDLSSADVVLGDGTWWISVVPVHEGDGSQPYWWVRQKDYEEGMGIFVRNGGGAHGNGYSGGWGGTSKEWKLFTSFGPAFLFPPGDVAMKVEGTPVSPPCAPADLDCNGSVGVPDLLLLLASWGECSDCEDCPADLTGNCAVGVPDLLDLLSNWG